DDVAGVYRVRAHTGGSAAIELGVVVLRPARLVLSQSALWIAEPDSVRALLVDEDGQQLTPPPTATLSETGAVLRLPDGRMVATAEGSGAVHLTLPGAGTFVASLRTLPMVQVQVSSVLGQ